MKEFVKMFKEADRLDIVLLTLVVICAISSWINKNDYEWVTWLCTATLVVRVIIQSAHIRYLQRMNEEKIQMFEKLYKEVEKIRKIS